MFIFVNKQKRREVTMRKIPILLVVICSLIIVNLAHSDKNPRNIDIDKSEFVNVKINIESKIIVGNGATVIIKSNNQTKARVLANIIDISQGGVIKELLNGKNINANITTKAETAEAVMENVVTLPLEFTIGQAYPNPFNPVVNVRFGLPKEAPVHIMIHDIAGRLIGDYKVGNRSAGWHAFSWNATDMFGQGVGTGVYLLTVQAGDKLQKQKITYIK